MHIFTKKARVEHWVSKHKETNKHITDSKTKLLNYCFSGREVSM